MPSKDNNLDGMVDIDSAHSAIAYADQLATQLKKGLLSYCVLLTCDHPVYTSEILERLHAAELSVVEGTIYPLLTRMQKDDLLQHSWQESPQGPPRKYYVITNFGRKVRQELKTNVTAINKAIDTLERSEHE